MSRFRTIPTGVALAALVLSIVGPVDLEAQRPYLPLRPDPGGGFPVIPFMEGWYNNGDGTYTISFGYLNRNDEMLELPIGPDNRIEPAEFGGMQPTAFYSGHQRGVFTVTITEAQRRTDVWWRLFTNGEDTSVPGRTNAFAYELDRIPRPHGTLAPVIWFEEGNTGQYPHGVISNQSLTTRVGELLTITVHAEDISERDPTDRRFQEAIPVNLQWYKHQGPPGEIEWVRHPSTPLPDPAEAGGGRGGGGRGGGGGAGAEPPANRFSLEEGEGTWMVQARFPAPGEWMVRVVADSHSAPDSSFGDQCCWTNGFVRVNVAP